MSGNLNWVSEEQRNITLDETSADFILLQYPLSERMLKPASSPAYYDDLMKELDEAPNRSWFGRLVKKWSGFIRLS